MEEFGASSSTATLLALLATVITVASILASFLFSGVSKNGYVCVLETHHLGHRADSPLHEHDAVCLYRLKTVPKAKVLPFYGDTDRLLKDGLNMEMERSQVCGERQQRRFRSNFHIHK